MKLDELIKKLEAYREKYGGHLPIDLLIDSNRTGQVEAHLNTTAVIVRYSGGASDGSAERVILAYEED